MARALSSVITLLQGYLFKFPLGFLFQPIEPAFERLGIEFFKGNRHMPSPEGVN